MTPFRLEDQEIIYLVYIGVALGIFLLFTGISQLLIRRETDTEARNRRMKMIRKGATTEEVLALLKQDTSSGPLTRIPVLGNLRKEMQRAGLTMKPAHLMLLCALPGVGVGVVSYRAAGPATAVLLAFGLSLLLPVAVVDFKKKKRANALVAQLPDALDLMARGLKVGHPLNTTIAHVAREMPDPIGTEFGLIFDQVAYGDDLVTAVQDLAERVDMEDVHYLAATIAIQHGTGGDLGRVITVLAKVIRDRIIMRRRIKAISSEGRATAYILSGLPFAIFGATNAMTPTYYSAVADQPLFLPMMLTIGGLVAANALILRKLVNFRI